MAETKGKRERLRKSRVGAAGREVVVKGMSGKWVVEETFGTKDEAIAHANEVVERQHGRAKAIRIRIDDRKGGGQRRSADSSKSSADAGFEASAVVDPALGASAFASAVIAALSTQIAAIPEAELRVTDDESPEEVAARFVASKRARNDWDDAVGPFLDTAGVIAWAGLGNRQNVSNAADRGDLLSLPVGNRRLYPRFQFSSTGQPLPRLRELLPILQTQMESPWTQALWLNTPVPVWDGRTPAEMLHRGDQERVLELARADVERRAS